MYDLAIAHGTVYAVTFDQSAPNFRVWSSPADHLAWTEDPIKIPVGAGPIPSIQLVLAGNAGWLIEVDRVGRRRRQAVADDRALVGVDAAVQERERPGDPRGLGHDRPDRELRRGTCGAARPRPGPRCTRRTTRARRSFATPHPCPGAVAAEDPNDAVIIAGQKASAQSNDGGRSWQTAVPSIDDSSGVDDLGFTSSSQGFVIFTDGKMIMTHDSGATWAAVRLP